MSYQVGLFCYSNLSEAGQAACVSFSPVSSMIDSGKYLRTISCQSASPITGALQLRVITTPLDGSGMTSTSTVEQSIAFPECQYQKYVDASEIIVGALLACIFSAYGLWKIRSILNWSRSDV